ncbi:hypothetical protein [Kribbella sp. NPDC051620]|uniref:hypothetical protein n=1 Tax=Kribbella sp. NPDC051620 TaxID=3364120 RepID=UPI003797757C
MGWRGWLTAAGVLVIVAGGAADGAAASRPAEVQVDPAAQAAAVDAILQRRATAVLQHDEDQFLADVDPYNEELRASQKVLFENLVQFGFGKLTYRQGDPQFDQTLLDKYGPTAYLVSAAMEYQIEGIDEQPMRTPLGYTFVKRDKQYVLVDDTALDTARPGSPNREAWDAGPVLVQRGPRTMAVVEQSQVELAKSILADAQVAVKAVNRWWLPSWQGGALVIALDDTSVRSADFNGPLWKDNSAVATPVQRADTAFGSAYVVVNPRDRDQLDARLLAHEFTHVATAADGPSAPLWLVEGMAEYVEHLPMGSERAVDLAKYRDHVRSKYLNKAKALPTDKQFFGPTQDSSYAIGWLAVDYLVRKYGLNQVVGLHQEMAWQVNSQGRRDTVMTAQLGRTEAQIFADLKRG